MARHRKQHRKQPGTPAPSVRPRRARHKLAAGLAGTSAVVATLLVLTVSPAAPPAPDRVPGGAVEGAAEHP
ncbi:hypothetical protein GCM10009801_51970 [Streptomyces albiaxialis]|uniref:Uncharacterized protein n=1 Tax=Streptomyces albiaxialis TaxID=329523 RepID=A0ABN2WB55_9ACTN